MATEAARPSASPAAASPPAAPTLTPAEFAHKWQYVAPRPSRSLERAAERLLGEEEPHR